MNHIMRRYEKTGLMRFVESRQADYMDCPAIDFQEALNTVMEAEQMFSEMPSNLRKRFNNDPGLFVDFACNPDNLEEMRELGLAKRIPETPGSTSGEQPGKEVSKEESI